MEKKLKKGMTGVGNKDFHQYIISDLIYGVRKKFSSQRKSKNFLVLPEISLEEIGYSKKNFKFSKNYNIDFVVIEKISGNIILVAEIERADKNTAYAKTKINECLKFIPTLKDAFIIKFSIEGEVNFESYSIDNEIMSISITSKSTVVGVNLKSYLISLKK